MDTFKDIFIVFLLIVLTLLFSAIHVRRQHTEVYNQVNVLLEECEAQLPRDKHCKIIAVEDK